MFFPLPHRKCAEDFQQRLFSSGSALDRAKFEGGASFAELGSCLAFPEHRIDDRILLC